MSIDQKARQYADEAFMPRKRRIGQTIRHITQGAAHIALGALLAALDAGRVAGEALIPGANHESENHRISTRGGRSNG